MDKILGITGTPGTGKKTVAPLVAAQLGWECLGLNDLAHGNGLVDPRTGEVDAGKLRDAVPSHLGTSTVVYGHLLPFVLNKNMVEEVVVLRCEPKVLRSRFQGRGYDSEKTRQNIEAELIGLISAEALWAFGKEKTWEIDTSKASPESIASQVSEGVGAVRKPKPWIDWTLSYGSAARLSSLLSV